MNNQTNKPLYKNRRSTFDYYFFYICFGSLRYFICYVEIWI